MTILALAGALVGAAAAVVVLLRRRRRPRAGEFVAAELDRELAERRALSFGPAWQRRRPAPPPTDWQRVRRAIDSSDAPNERTER